MDITKLELQYISSLQYLHKQESSIRYQMELKLEDLNNILTTTHPYAIDYRAQLEQELESLQKQMETTLIAIHQERVNLKILYMFIDLTKEENSE